MTAQLYFAFKRDNSMSLLGFYLIAILYNTFEFCGDILILFYPSSFYNPDTMNQTHQKILDNLVIG